MKQSPSLKKQAAKSFLWTSTGQWGFHILNALTFIALSRPLEPEDFGIWALITLFYELSHATLMSGFTTALVQKTSISDQDLNSTFWGQAGLIIFFLMSAQLLAAPVALLLGIPEFEVIWRVASCALIFDSLNVVPLALIHRNFKFHWFALQKTGGIAAGALAGIYAAFNGYGIWSFVIFYSVMAITRFIIIWSCAGWFPRIQFSVPHFFEVSRFSYQLAIHHILTFIRKRFDDLLIGIVLGPAILGFYNVAYRLLFIVMDLLNAPLQNVSMSFLSRLQHDSPKALEAYTKIVRLNCTLALPAFTGISLLAPTIISLIFGDKWLAAAPLLNILALSGIALSFYNLNVIALASLKKTKLLIQLSATFTLCSCLIYSIAILGGVEWVAIACLFVSLALWPLSSHFLIRSVTQGAGVTPSYNMVKVSIATLCMAANLIGMKTLTQSMEPWQQFLTCVVTSMTVFILTLLILDRTFIQDIREVLSLVVKKTEHRYRNG